MPHPSLEAFVLGALQGLTEFLPVSSSAHLILAHIFFPLHSPGLDSNLFDAVLHGGSLAAVIVMFRTEIAAMLRDRTMLAWIALSAVPALATGFAVSPWKETTLRSPMLCAAMLVLFGIYMIVADRRRPAEPARDMDIRMLVILGLAQTLALLPGVSRSGVTIATALMLGMGREDAVTTSFLMAMPVTSAAFLYKLKDAVTGAEPLPASTLAAGLLSSFAFGLLAVVVLRSTMRRIGLSCFAWYRFCLAAVTVVVIW